MNKKINESSFKTKAIKEKRLNDEVINYLISLSIKSRALAKRMIMCSFNNERK